MSKIASHHKCVLCDQVLGYPQNCQMLDYIILIIQFYKTHEICEQNPILIEAFEKKLKEQEKKEKSLLRKKKRK